MLEECHQSSDIVCGQKHECGKFDRVIGKMASALAKLALAEHISGDGGGGGGKGQEESARLATTVIIDYRCGSDFWKYMFILGR